MTTAMVTIQGVDEAAERVAQACRAEMELEDQRPLVKMEAVRRIMTRDSIAATPAEKIVESDAEYMSHRAKQYAAVVEKQRAFGALEAAKLRARLSVEMMTVGLAP